MDKISKFVTCLIPVHACNFRCQYCYLSHHVNQDAYGGGIRPFGATPQKIVKYFSVDRMGGPCYFNLCAPGETMMHPELIEFVSELTKEGHYADIVTNGTLSKKIDELIDALDDYQRKHLFIKFSFHYLELQKKNMMEIFLEDVEKIRKSGVSYSIEITPYDELIPHIDEIKNFSIEHFGALPHVTVARNEGTKEIALLTKHTRAEYKQIWSVFDSSLFDFKFSIFNTRRNEFCYAGLWSLAVDIETGIYRQCYGGDELGNVNDGSRIVNFRPIGKCRLPHCFNGHAFLATGDIPELEAPTYTDERDRVRTDGEHWFSEEERAFFSTKLCESNEMLTDEQKKKQQYINTCMHCVEFGKRACRKVSKIVKKTNAKKKDYKKN